MTGSGMHTYQRLVWLFLLNVVVAPYANSRDFQDSQPQQHLNTIQNERKNNGKCHENLNTTSPVESVLMNDDHCYEIMLVKGQFLHVVVNQRGIDVVMQLFGPDNKVILKKVDRPNGTHGTESLAIIAEVSGVHRIVLAPFKKKVAAGHYTIAIKEIRPPTILDHKHVAAEQSFLEAEQLRNKSKKIFQHKALDKYREALALFNEVGDLDSAALINQLIATIHLSWGESEKAIERCNLALKLYKTSFNLSGEGAVLNLLGGIYSISGESEKALEYHNNAYRLFRRVGNADGEAATLNYLGGIHYTLGEYQQALDNFQQALPLWQTLQYISEEATTLEGIGLAYHALDEKQKAIDSYKKALQAYRNAKDSVGESQTLVSLLLLYISQGEMQKVVEYYYQVTSLSNASWTSLIGDNESSNAAPTIAQIVEPAIRAVSSISTTGDLHREAAALNNMGYIHLAFGQSLPALKCYNKALLLNSQTGNRAGLGRTLHNLMLYWKRQQKNRLAIFYGKKAINVYQEIRGYISGLPEVTRRQFVKSRENTYRILADLLISEGRLIEAQQVLNLLKEEEYFQFLQEDLQEAATLTGRATLTNGEADWEKRYKQVIDNVLNIFSRQSEMREQLDETADEQQAARLNDDLRTANRELERFHKNLVTEASGALKGSNSDIREAQDLINSLRELGSGVVALYTLVSDDSYSVMLISPGRVKAYKQNIKIDDLNDEISEFRDALQNPNSDPLPAAKKLYQTILSPVAKDLKELKAHTLMWSLDGMLRTVPVAALHDGEKYLIESYAIEVFTPATQGVLKDQPSMDLRGVAFGVSEGGEGYTDLPAILEEIYGIIRDENANNKSGIIPGKVFPNAAFTEEALRRSLQQRFPIVHIASHFQFTPTNELDSFLLLGDGSRFSLRAVKAAKKLFSGVELLTLSACDTATSDVGTNGREIDGLAELSQRQGAKAVIASLWPVDDGSTSFLMQKFYDLLYQQPRINKAEALKKAQLELLRCQEQEPYLSEEDQGLSKYMRSEADCLPHPYYWAPFILIGNWR